MIRPSAAIVYLDEHREPRRGVVRLAGRVRMLLVLSTVRRACVRATISSGALLLHAV